MTFVKTALIYKKGRPLLSYYKPRILKWRCKLPRTRPIRFIVLSSQKLESIFVLQMVIRHVLRKPV